MGLIRRLICGGTTSACAENTPCPQSPTHPCWNYLRVRGEYRSNHFFHASVVELPPRARRILKIFCFCITLGGTTSACAENTFSIWATGMTWWNYLRVRGEYAEPVTGRGGLEELPPRARRIRRSEMERHHSKGTTSACAENTYGTPGYGDYRRNYLRVRGEYVASNPVSSSPVELPPRARRIR